MTRGDLGIVGIVVALVVGSLLLAAAPNAADSSAIIKGPSGVTRVSLDHDATYVVEGALGAVTFEVADGTMRCTESSCPDHLCMRAGTLAPGQPIVCAPNRVIVRLADRSRGDLDAVSR